MSDNKRQQLIVVVEGTPALESYWQSILSDYLEKIIRSFAANELAGQASFFGHQLHIEPSNSNVEFAYVTFNSDENDVYYIVQRTGWTKNPDTFLKWMASIPFCAGDVNYAETTEGLSEAVRMFEDFSNAIQPQQRANVQKHCILVAASNPNPLPIPVNKPRRVQSDNKELQIGSCLADAEAIAKFFPQISVSLSVICPKQLPKLRAIYDAGKCSPRLADPVFDDAKNPNFLVLISEGFMEARNALIRTGVLNIASNESPEKKDMSFVTAVTGPVPTSMGAVPNSAPNASGLLSAEIKYVKVWEGNLSGLRLGQPVFVTRLEGYRRSSASETLAANWPQTMQILRLVSQDQMHNRQFVEKADFLVFRAMNHHGFLGQLQQKKLCAVIQLPSQTLLLSVTDKANRLIGLLLPGVILSQPATTTASSSNAATTPTIES
ncbi:hypothetical protein ACFE04_030890 [Oxalis oulophora]